MKENRLLLRLELESFKSIARLEQDLGQLTVLVGENSAGKSSFMQAVVLASQVARSNVEGGALSLRGAEVDLGDFNHLLHSGRAAQEVTVRLTLRDDAAESLALEEPLAGFKGHYLQWNLTFGRPSGSESGATLQRVALASSAWESELSATLIDPNSGDAAERDRAEGKRLLLKRSAALASAGGDSSLNRMARSTEATEGLHLFEGQLRDHEAVRVSDGDQIDTYHLVSIESGLPSLAMQSVENTRAAIRAFLEMDGGGSIRARRRALTREELEKGPGYDLFDEIAPYLPAIEEHFLRWLEQLDDAMRDPTDLRVPLADFPSSAEWILDHPFSHNELSDLMKTKMSLDGFVPRDHLERQFPKVLEVADTVQNSLSRRLHLLGPLREDPTPVYRPGDKGTGITTLGLKGENTVAYLDERGGDLVVCPLHLNQDEDQLSGRARSEEMRLRDAVVYWLEKLGIAGDLRLRPVGRMLEFDLVDQQTRDRRDLTSVGVGASQILPVVVQCLVAEPGDLVLLEQPELHLHPRPQQILGDFLLGIAQTGRQLIVETHSEYLVNRLRRRMVEQGLEADEDMIRLLYARRENGATTFDELRPNKFGSFDSWPEGFFDQSPRESEEIVRAAAARRRAERSASE